MKLEIVKLFGIHIYMSMIYVFLLKGNVTFSDFMATITGKKANAVVSPFVIKQLMSRRLSTNHIVELCDTLKQMRYF